jgi:hypothetical protein
MEEVGLDGVGRVADDARMERGRAGETPELVNLESIFLSQFRQC